MGGFMRNFLFLLLAMCLHMSAFAQQGITAKYLRLTPSALPSICNTGDLRFDIVTSQLEFCDANVWTPFSAVGGGGTGLGYINPFATLVGNGSGAIQMIGPGNSGYVYVSTGNGSNPAFQQLNLTSGQAITGTLQPTSGGTGLSSIGSNNQVLTVSGTGLVWNTVTLPGAVSSVSGSYPIFSTSGSTPTLSLSGAVPIVNGGTGLTAVGSNGQILTTSGTSVLWAAVPSTGVTSVSGSYPINSTSGATPILSLSGAVGTINGGTGLTSVGTSGQVLTVSGTMPAWITPITGGAGSVTSVSGSYPIFSTSGATPVLSLSGAVPFGNGGTGLITLGTSGQVLTVSGGTSLIWGTIPSGFTNPMTTSGDIITGNSGGIAARLGIGSTNQVLTVSGGVPVWAASATASGSFFQQNGNAFGASGVLGTTDKNALQFIVSGSTAMTISPTSGFVGIGTQYPTHPITLVSGSSGMAFYNTADQLINYERGTIQFINNNLLLGTEFGGSGQARMFRFGAASSAGSNIMSSGKTINIAGTAPFFIINASTSQVGNIMDYSSTTMSSTTGKQVGLDVNPTISQSAGGLFTAFLVNPTLTTQSSGTNLIVDFQAANISKFSVNSSGSVAIGPITPVTALDVSGAINHRAMAQPAVAAANAGVIYFDSSTGLFKASQSGAAYVNLIATGLTNPMTTSGDIIIGNSGGTPARLGIGSSNQILSVSGGVPVWTTSSAGGLTVPNFQTLTSGISATYTTPSGCLYLEVTGVAGGGGGGGSGGSTGPNGNFGGITVFNGVTAAGASPGAGATGTNGGLGGTGGTGGGGTASIRKSGAPGMSGPAGTSLTGADFGGQGGASGGGFGGGGIEPPTATPGNAGLLYGGGGSGCGTGGSSGTSGGGGGGELFELLIVNPAATYVYTVGSGGTGGIGTGGGAVTGGAGASGVIQVRCKFQ